MSQQRATTTTTTTTTTTATTSAAAAAAAHPAVVRRICVFCGSSAGRNPVYVAEAEKLARAMVARGIGLVYGGGNMGLMGAVAKATHDAGGAVHGVIPEAMTKIEGIGLLGETTLVKTMHERKSLMNDLSDAFIALPGGFGTFEELLEMTTWSQLSIHSKPIGVLNVAGFYDPLVALVDGAAREGFVKEGNRGLVIVRDNVDALLDALQAFRPPEGRFDIPWSAV